MAGQRQDYLLRQIELLRQFVARLAGSGDPAGVEQALQLALHLQERLFAMPPADFLRQPVAKQIAFLIAGESKSAGQEKCLTYAALLTETATLYRYRGRDDLAFGAGQLALHVALEVALAAPTASSAAKALVSKLSAALESENLHPPVRELLDQFATRGK